MGNILSLESLLLIGEFSNDDWIGCEYSANKLPAERTEDYLAQDGADGAKCDEICVVEVWAYPDDEDDFGYFDEEGMLVALFCLEGVN